MDISNTFHLSELTNIEFFLADTHQVMILLCGNVSCFILQALILLDDNIFFRLLISVMEDLIE